ncbi:MAG: CinA family protein, partial [Lachnospiraceae bacterium]|nr:CinA family protein [Lachnospiraceae bacterium]
IKSDVCVGVTGYADGEDTGHVFIACNVRGKTEVREFHFVGNRSKVRESATTQALVLLRDCVLRYLSNLALS